MAYILPKGEKDDQFDTADFQEWPVRCKILLQLYVELDEAVHGNGDSDSIKAQYPDVSKKRTQCFFAVASHKSRYECDKCEKNSNQAILKHAYPNNLRKVSTPSSSIG